VRESHAQTGTFIDRLDPSDLRVVSYNPYWDTIFPDVNPDQANKFARLVNALDPDVLCLQEISRSAAEVASLMDGIAPLAGGGSWQAHQGRNSVIVSKYPLSMTATATVPSGQYDLAMALVDLPDDRFTADFYVMNDHFKCCEGSTNDAKRQRQADALVNWMRDARTPGENIDLPDGTALAVIGDLNMVGSLQPLTTLITGDIYYNTWYGPDSPPDWDGTDATDAHPLHNGVGPEDYTWRNDWGVYDPGRLDYIIYTDSVISESYKFVLNTVTMSAADLAAAGLQTYDVCLDDAGINYDHLPVVVDFARTTIDCNLNGVLDSDDIAGGTSLDCNANGVPDECDVAEGTSTDCQGNAVPDECDPDQDLSGIPDDCEFDCVGAELGKLLASDGASNNYFGFSVAVSGDVAVVGAYGDDDQGTNSGAAYVFRFDGSTWRQEAKLTASDGASLDYFGFSVAVSGDVVVVGAYRDDDQGTDSGSAYVYRYDGSTWIEEAKLVASDGAYRDYFGCSVAVSGDVAVVGAYWGNDNQGTSSGSAYVFRFDGSAWCQETKLTVTGGATYDYFGYSVAVSGDVAVVGAYGEDGQGTDSGAAYVFHFAGSVWTQEAKLTASDRASYDCFGASVACSGDVAVVGAYRDDDQATHSGSAYVFRFDGSTWIQEVKLTASDGASYDYFGHSVAISGDVAVVGASRDDDNGTDSGSAYVYEFDGATWVEAAKLAASDGAVNDYFGYSVAVSGGTAVIGVYRYGPAMGAAYAFDVVSDCNGNETADICDLADGTSADENANGIPDECEDCNGNGIFDEIEPPVLLFQNLGEETGVLDTTAAVAQDVHMSGVGDALLSGFTVYYRSTGSSPGVMTVRFWDNDLVDGSPPGPPAGLLAEYTVDRLQLTPSFGPFGVAAVSVDPRLTVRHNLWIEVEISQQAGVILRPGPTTAGSTHGLIYDRNAADYLPGGPMLMGLRVEGVLCRSDCNGNGIDDEIEIDSDGDNLIDACDACPNEPALLAPAEPGEEATCADGVDNDCDGDTDMQDNDCAGYCPYPCGDLTNDGFVNLDDFATFATCFALDSPLLDCDAAEFACCDLTGDGRVDLDDFTTFTVMFATVPTATVPNCTD
jgi:endonuclease/exonuclease/phosphatase family metal-dependent hydrolase